MSEEARRVLKIPATLDSQQTEGTVYSSTSRSAHPLQNHGKGLTETMTPLYDAGKQSPSNTAVSNNSPCVRGNNHHPPPLDNAVQRPLATTRAVLEIRPRTECTREVSSRNPKCLSVDSGRESM